MEITLTTRWVEYYQKQITKTLAVGDQIEYYHDYNERIDNPSKGIVKEDDNGLYIQWEDIGDLTHLDGSGHTELVLKNCGFAR